MKSHDEIKKGLECHARPCGCDMACPYVEECREDEGCPMSKDALGYISQLESQNRCFKEIKESCERRMIDMAQRMPRWISVEERLPEVNEDVVLIMPVDDGHCIRIGWRTKGGNWWAAGQGIPPITVTHWMPLPEPPKEEAK